MTEKEKLELAANVLRHFGRNIRVPAEYLERTVADVLEVPEILALVREDLARGIYRAIQGAVSHWHDAGYRMVRATKANSIAAMPPRRPFVGQENTMTQKGISKN